MLPAARTIALIEFVHENDAKQAFSSLVYTKFKHVPLYLEWAPLNIFKKPPKPEASSSTSDLSPKKKEDALGTHSCFL